MTETPPPKNNPVARLLARLLMVAGLIFAALSIGGLVFTAAGCTVLFGMTQPKDYLLHLSLALFALAASTAVFLLGHRLMKREKGDRP